MAHFSCTVLGVLRLTPGIAHTLQEKQVHQKEVPKSYVINFLFFNKIGAKLIKPKCVAFVTLVTSLNPFSGFVIHHFAKQLNACPTFLLTCAFGRNRSKLWLWAGKAGKFQIVNYTK